MDSSLLDLLNKVTLFDLILALLLISILIGILVSQKKRISKTLDKWRKNKNDEEDFHALVFDLKDAVESLRREVRQNQEDRDRELLKYRDDSRKIREEMYQIMNGQSKEIKNLTKTIGVMHEKQSKTKRAELKEKIERIYRECSPTQTCTDMAFETLRELIEEYEEHGGVNSFVHSIVEPEMYEWEVVKRVKGDRDDSREKS